MTQAMNLPLVTMTPKEGGWLSRDMVGLAGSKVVKFNAGGLEHKVFCLICGSK
jgi:hypothetical protein